MVAPSGSPDAGLRRTSREAFTSSPETATTMLYGISGRALKLSDTAPRTTQTSIQRRRREEKPNEEAKSKQLGSFTPADWKSMSDNDFDLSAGPALIRGTKWWWGRTKEASSTW